jgi:hypothetical protein
VEISRFDSNNRVGAAIATPLGVHHFLPEVRKTLLQTFQASSRSPRLKRTVAQLRAWLSWLQVPMRPQLRLP